MYESVIPAILGFTVGILVTSVAWALAARLRESREDKIRARGRGVLVRISEIEGELDNAVAAYETGDTDKEALKKELSSGLK